METEKKMSVGEWIENIWYHYKWVIIFGGAMLLFLVISLFQWLSTPDPDVNVLHVGPMYISAEAGEQLKDSVASLSYDYNGDDEIAVALLDITVNKFGNEEAGVDAVNYDHQKSATQRFQSEIRAGDAMLYLLDKEYFDICISENLLTPLDEILDDADMPENSISGYGIPISELDAYELPGLSSVPSTAILCLRRSPEKDELRYGRTVEAWDNNRNTFINIVKYRAN